MQADPAGGSRATVLLAEDDPAIRSVAKRFLEADGFRVLEAKSGEEAARLGARHAGDLDVLIADLVMPGFGGPDLAERLVRDRPGLKVLFLSGYSEAEARVRDPRVARAPFLQKPFTAQALRDALTGLLAT